MGGTLAPTAAPGGIAGTGIGLAQRAAVAPPPPPEANLAYKKSGEESGGVIAIYTRAGVGMPPSRPRSSAQGVRQYVRVGFYAPREFYSPAYEGPAEDALKPDYRTTLFWAPNVVLDENGRAMLSFYTSDKASSYRVVVEGMTADGRPVRAVERLDVSY